jgi:hypothetical protein
MLTIGANTQPFTQGQAGWWTAMDDPADPEGQLSDAVVVIRAATRREAAGDVPEGQHYAGDFSD